MTATNTAAILALAGRVIDAWESSPLNTHDGRLFECIEDLRAELSLTQLGSQEGVSPTDKAKQRDAIFQAAIDFIGTLTGMKPPPIEVAPPEVFAPFYSFVDKVQEIVANSGSQE